MKEKLNYYREDIEKWVFENYQNFNYAETPKEYADNAVKYHNSKYCKEHCPCVNENREFVRPRLSVENKKWFKEVVADLIDYIWVCNTYIGIIKKDMVTRKKTQIEN